MEGRKEVAMWSGRKMTVEVSLREREGYRAGVPKYQRGLTKEKRKATCAEER